MAAWPPPGAVKPHALDTAPGSPLPRSFGPPSRDAHCPEAPRGEAGTEVTIGQVPQGAAAGARGAAGFFGQWWELPNKAPLLLFLARPT